MYHNMEDNTGSARGQWGMQTMEARRSTFRRGNPAPNHQQVRAVQNLHRNIERRRVEARGQRILNELNKYVSFQRLCVTLF